MERPTCGTCPYWESVTACNIRLEIHDPHHEDDDIFGTCRRLPPMRSVFSYAGGVHRESDWPDTNDADWCGEHPQFLAWIKARTEPATTEPDP
jgi:hypothetical protein